MIRFRLVHRSRLRVTPRGLAVLALLGVAALFFLCAGIASSH